MSASISPSTGRIYGVKRVCRVLGFPRSTFYLQQERERKVRNGTRAKLKKRGPKPKISDTVLLKLVKADLAASLLGGGLATSRNDGDPTILEVNVTPSQVDSFASTQAGEVTEADHRADLVASSHS